MAGCSTKHDGAGDYDAGETRVLGWVFGGAAALGLAAFLEAAGIAGLVGGALAIAFAAILVSALAGAVLGFFIGFAVLWFDRLHVQNPATITMAGCVLCAGKNSGIPPFHDNDWTFNLGGSSLALLNPIIAGLDVQEIRTRDAPGNRPRRSSTRTPACRRSTARSARASATTPPSGPRSARSPAPSRGRSSARRSASRSRS
jgi:hypothetical protein